MKHLFLIGFISLASMTVHAGGPTCAEYFKYKGQGTDRPYNMPMSDFGKTCHIVPDKKWPPQKEECPQPQNHLAIVTEHVYGSNSTVYCKLNIVDANETPNDTAVNGTRYIDCTSNLVKVNSLVLIAEGYYETYDKLGNLSCLSSVSLIQVL